MGPWYMCPLCFKDIEGWVRIPNPVPCDECASTLVLNAINSKEETI